MGRWKLSIIGLLAIIMTTTACGASEFFNETKELLEVYEKNMVLSNLSDSVESFNMYKAKWEGDDSHYETIDEMRSLLAVIARHEDALGVQRAEIKKEFLQKSDEILKNLK